MTSGCWTCKLRHRKCDLRTPTCRECNDRCIPCHGFGPKPSWMDGAAAERQELTRIKKAVKQNLRNLHIHKSQVHDRQVDRDSTPFVEASSTTPQAPVESESLSTPPAEVATGSPSPMPPRHVRFTDDVCHSDEHNHSSEPSPVEGGHHGQSHIGDDGNAPTHLRRPQQPAHSCGFRPDSASLVMHYLDHVFYWQYPYFRPNSRLGNRGWLLPFLINGGPLYHAALALSALHRNAIQVSRRRDYLHNQEAFEYHSQALRELCEFSRRNETETTLLGDKSRLAEFVASSLMSISFEVFHGAEYDWLPHLDAVTTVLSMHSPEALLANLTSPESTDSSRHYGSNGGGTDFDFLIAQTIWFDILACVSTGRVPRIAYRQWLEASKLDMADLMGCYNWVMVCIGDLAHLQSWKADMKEHGTLSVPELVTRSRSIEACLQNGIDEVETAIQENTEAPQAAWVSHIFALASLILSSTIVSGPWASLPEVKTVVEKVVDVLHGWPRTISLQGLVWPLCIIGCMAEPGHQPFFESLLSEFVDECRGFGNGGTVLRVMKDCWSLQGQRDRNGMDLAFQTGVRVLLI